MKNDLEKEINAINSNIEVLPTNNKKNVEKFNEYIDECLAKYKPMLEECENEIRSRYNETLEKFKNLTFNLPEVKIDYASVKLSDKRVSSDEKMNLDYLFYKLNNSQVANLDEVNQIVKKIIESFKIAGIELTEKDFNYSDSVNIYIKTLLNSEAAVQDVFNELYFKTPDIILQIELNFRYLFYKNKSKIDDFYAKKYEEFNFDEFLANHIQQVNNVEQMKHQSVKYIYDLFMNKTLEVDEFIVESKVQNLLSSMLVDPAYDRNYENLVNLKKSLIEYKGYLKFEYIIKDFKELYSHKNEFKGLFENKLKEISKKEHNLFALNKKLNKKGFFMLNRAKRATVTVEKNKLVEELINDYNELDNLKIKETINLYIMDDTNYYSMLKFATYNFNYFIKLLTSNNDELTMSNINNIYLELSKYLYDNEFDIINHISILEDKEIDKIIVEMYKLNNINLTVDKLDITQIDKTIETVDKLLLYYDIFNLMINLKDIDFLLNVPIVLGK